MRGRNGRKWRSTAHTEHLEFPVVPSWLPSLLPAAGLVRIMADSLTHIKVRLVWLSAISVWDGDGDGDGDGDPHPS
jgi:hypothetical protein